MDPENYKLKIRTAYKLQKHSKCLALIAESPQSVQSDSQYKILSASCLNNLGQSKEAHRILDEVIEQNPTNAFAYYGKGLVFINEARLGDGVKCFDKAIEVDPSEKISKARHMKVRAENMMKSMKLDRIKKEKLDSRPKPINSGVPPGIRSCPVCEKAFAKSFSLTRHMLLHTGERPHKCTICGFGFIQKSDLLRHITTHSNEMKFECQKCGKRFKTKKNLQCHVATHSTERPFKCGQCDKSFKQQRLLNFHEKLHMKPKPFRCDQCSKEFTTKPLLKEHLQTHARESDKKQVRAVKIQSSFEPIAIKTELTFEEPTMHIKSEPHAEQADYVMDVLSGRSTDQELTFGDIVYNPVEGSDDEFLRSLMKDLKRMNEEQKRKFRQRTLSLIDEILN